MDALMNSIKQLANLEQNDKTYGQPCIIQHYDPKLYRVKVLLVPDEIETGWVPLSSWGEIMPPVLGTQATIIFIRGDINYGIVIGNVFSQAMPPPQDEDVTQPGSYLLKTDNGASIKVTNSGQIIITPAEGKTLILNSDVNVIAGNIGESVERLVKESLKDLYNQHTHPSTGAPPAPAYLLTDNDLTEILKGN